MIYRPSSGAKIKINAANPEKGLAARVFGIPDWSRTNGLSLRRTVYTLSPDMAWSITTPQTRVITGFLSEHDVFSPLVFLLIFLEDSYSD